MNFKKYFLPCVCLCFIFFENSSAGTSTKNTPELQHKVQKKPQKFKITPKQIEQGINFTGRTLDSLLNNLMSSLSSLTSSSTNITSSINKNITSLTSSLPSLSSFSTSSIITGLGNQVAKIPLFIGLPVLIIGITILTIAIAFIVAYIPGYTSPIYNKFVDEYGDFFQFDDDSDAANEGYGQQSQSGWQSPSNSYGAPQGDSYSNSRVTYVQAAQQPNYSYQRPAPNREQLNTASQQLHQAVNKYSQI